MTQSQEDYLKAIESLGGKEHYVSNKQLVEYLNHTGASVSGMVQQLKKNGYIEYQAYKGSKLTLKGMQQVALVSEIHRLWEVFLVDKLNLTLKQAHHQADLFEHNTSPETMEALYEYLGRPKYCPHGYPLDNQFIQATPLVEFEVSDRVLIEYMLEEDQLLDYLQDRGLMIKEVYEIVEKQPFNGDIILKKQDKQVTLTYLAASKLFVIKQN